MSETKARALLVIVCLLMIWALLPGCQKQALASDIAPEVNPPADVRCYLPSLGTLIAEGSSVTVLGRCSQEACVWKDEGKSVAAFGAICVLRQSN